MYQRNAKRLKPPSWAVEMDKLPCAPATSQATTELRPYWGSWYLPQ